MTTHSSSDKTTIKQVGGYSVVPRNVAQYLRKHAEALGLYIFLLSLPDGWQFRKSWLRAETNIGLNKLDRLIAFLKKCNLVTTRQLKVKGRFAEFEMSILDGKDFKQGDLDPLFKSPFNDFRGTVDVATENKHKILDIKKEDKEIKDIYCSSGDEPQIDEAPAYEPIPMEKIKTPPMLEMPVDPPEKRRERIESKAAGAFRQNADEWFEKEQKLIWFEMFWESYPKKVGKMKAQESWQKNKLEAIGEKIVSDVLDRAKRHAQWQDKQFIPYPATYLNQQRWTDEIIEETKEKENGNKTTRLSRIAQANIESIEDVRRAYEREQREQYERACRQRDENTIMA